MLDRPGLRERLGELVRSRRWSTSDAPPDEAAAEGAPSAPSPRPRTTRSRRTRGTADEPAWFRADAALEGGGEGEGSECSVGVDAILPGGEWRDARGTVYVHERLRSDIERRRPHWGRLGTPPEREEELLRLVQAGLGRALFLDLETGGLASSPVFLAGTMHWNGEDFVIRQYFARHYGEEATLLGALHQAVQGFEYLVTFNGKSYDAPFLLGRAHVHGVAMTLPPRHLDLLHPSRRRWKGTLRDCRLQTLEAQVCRRWRSGDVPSDEVPGLYHDFVRRGDPYRLVPVFHHNMLDVITMGEILRELCTPTSAPDDEDPLPEPADYRHSQVIDF